jgi:hypothetical protein
MARWHWVRRFLIGGGLALLVTAACLHQSLAAETGQKKGRGGGTQGRTSDHSVPKSQPETAVPPTLPFGEGVLGVVHLETTVRADAKPLPPGTYEVRLTAQSVSSDAKGQTASLERWVEFRQNGQVKGREVVTIVPQSEIEHVQKDAPPRTNGSKVEALKGGDYVRIWINRGGNHYLIHLPTS